MAMRNAAEANHSDLVERFRSLHLDLDTKLKQVTDAQVEIQQSIAGVEHHVSQAVAEVKKMSAQANLLAVPTTPGGGGGGTPYRSNRQHKTGSLSYVMEAMSSNMGGENSENAASLLSGGNGAASPSHGAVQSERSTGIGRDMPIRYHSNSAMLQLDMLNAGSHLETTDLDSAEGVKSASDRIDDQEEEEHHHHKFAMLPTTWPQSLDPRIAPVSSADEFQGLVELQKLAKNMGQLMSRRDAVRVEEAASSMTSSAFNPLAVRKRRRPLVLEPSSNCRLLLDMLSLLALCYDMAAIPYALAWDVEIVGWWEVMGWISTIFWTIDLLVGFRTGFFRNGILEMSTRGIAREYLRTFFIPNLLIVASDWTTLLVPKVSRDDSGGTGSGSVVLLRISKVSRLLRISRVLRMLRLPLFLERLTDAQEFRTGGMIFLEAVKVLFLLLTVNHMQCCLFYSISAYGSSDTGLRWLELMEDDTITYEESGALYQYLTAFHWSLTQMTPGSMQVNAVNSWERAFTISCLISGLLFFSSLISSLSSKMTNFQAAQRERTAKLTTLKRYLRQFKISSKLAVSIQKQAAAELSMGHKLSSKDVPALAVVSISLQADLAYEMFKPSLVHHQLFMLWTQVNQPAVKKMCLEGIDLVPVPPGISLFVAGSKAQNAYRLVHGTFIYSDHLDGEPENLEFSVEFQDGRWVAEAALWCHWVHVGTLEAVGFAEAIAIEADSFASIMDESAATRQLRREYTKMYHARLTSACPPRAPFPTDLAAAFTSFEEICASMRKEARTFIGMVAIQDMAKKAWVWDRNSMEELECELREGRCTLTQTNAGEAQRVVFVTVLKLEQPDGTILTELGKWKETEGAIKADLKLSGSKQQDGEGPGQALQRIIDKKSQLLGSGVMVEGYTVDVKLKTSAKYKLPTKYVRTIYHARLKEAMQMDKAITATVDRSPDCSLPTYPIFLGEKAGQNGFRPVPTVLSPSRRGSLVEEDGAVLHAWLTSADFERFQQEPEELENWLSFVTVPEEPVVCRTHSGLKRVMSNMTSAKIEDLAL